MSGIEENRSGLRQSATPPVDGGGLKPPPSRPRLVAPPSRPTPPPSEPGPDSSSAILATAVVSPSSLGAMADSRGPESHSLPIAPPSEPMQYRAIGLVRGTYTPLDPTQINRGNLVTADGASIDAVLLGRVTSLVKKYLDLSLPHLWVVYPRTRHETDDDSDPDLHLQIVGVWEPETLGLPGETPGVNGSKEIAEADPAPVPPTSDLPTVEENFFSVRGEVVKYSPESQAITVKILQGAKRSPGDPPKSLKLTLQGAIEGRTVGYFWDFRLKRQGKILILDQASVVAIVPPKKRSKIGRRPPSNRRPGGDRPQRSTVGDRPVVKPRKVQSEGDLKSRDESA